MSGERPVAVVDQFVVTKDRLKRGFGSVNVLVGEIYNQPDNFGFSQPAPEAGYQVDCLVSKYAMASSIPDLIEVSAYYKNKFRELKLVAVQNDGKTAKIHAYVKVGIGYEFVSFDSTALVEWSYQL